MSTLWTLLLAMKTYSKHPSRHIQKRMRLLKVTQIYQPLASLIQTDSVTLTHHPQQTLSILSDIVSFLHARLSKAFSSGCNQTLCALVPFVFKWINAVTHISGLQMSKKIIKMELLLVNIQKAKLLSVALQTENILRQNGLLFKSSLWKNQIS